MSLFAYRDFQTNINTIQAGWDMSGDPCPAVRYEWAIRRVDGLEVSSFLDMGGQDSSFYLFKMLTDSSKHGINFTRFALHVRSMFLIKIVNMWRYIK